MEKDFTKQFIDILFKTFRFTIDFLEKNNITWYACGGTTLGAVRHQGIIPWDDDIDIYVPRKDYDRLMQLRPQLIGTGYKISSYTDKGYYLPFAKIEDVNTSIWEQPQFEYITGVYIDIFPMDSFDMSEDEVIALQWKYKKLWWNYNHALNSMSWAECRRLKDPVLTHSYWMHKLLWWKKKALYKQIDKFEKWFANQSGENCVCVPQWEGRVFKTSWFESLKRVPFNDLEVMIPGNSDAYLTKLYGDYMTPPPPEQRVMAHEASRHYCNLTRRVTIEEARRDVNAGNLLIY